MANKFKKPSTWFSLVAVLLLAITLLAKAIGWSWTSKTFWTVIFVLTALYLFGQSLWLEKTRRKNMLVHRISGYLSLALLIVAFAPFVYLETVYGRFFSMFVIGVSAIFSVIEIFVD